MSIRKLDKNKRSLVSGFESPTEKIRSDLRFLRLSAPPDRPAAAAGTAGCPRRRSVRTHDELQKQEVMSADICKEKGALTSSSEPESRN